MITKKVKIFNIEEPPKQGRTHWSLWKLEIDFGNGAIVSSYMNEDDFKLFKHGQYLLDKGINGKDLETLIELANVVSDREHAEDDADASL